MKGPLTDPTISYLGSSQWGKPTPLQLNFGVFVMDSPSHIILTSASCSLKCAQILLLPLSTHSFMADISHSCNALISNYVTHIQHTH